jgi:hypothetical protein
VAVDLLTDRSGCRPADRQKWLWTCWQTEEAMKEWTNVNKIIGAFYFVHHLKKNKICCILLLGCEIKLDKLIKAAQYLHPLCACISLDLCVLTCVIVGYDNCQHFCLCKTNRQGNNWSGLGKMWKEEIVPLFLKTNDKFIYIISIVHGGWGAIIFLPCRTNGASVKTTRR